ncbi:MAG: uncharacterized protein K0S12_543 [Bacteroidetes bacterium]|nr:uncharacterized protein [Bacteroidota bacterium]
MISKQGIHELFNLDVNENSPGVIIFSEQVTPRLHYVCSFIFGHVMNVKWVITSDKQEFQSSSFFKINYSVHLIEEVFQIVPAALLFESSVTSEKLEVLKKNGLVYFYAKNAGPDFHFDIFSAVFFLISRYEEWQDHQKDQHGRFELKESFLFKLDFHLKPVADIWIGELKKALAAFYPQLIFPVKEFSVVATLDVDNLFAYKSKGFLRTVGAALKDLVKLDLANLKRRIGVVLGGKKDPFDIYESFSKFCYGHNIPVLWFFLFRSGTRHDRTVNPSSTAFDAVLSSIKNNHGIAGLHPSYDSSADLQQMRSEVHSFSQKLGEPVTITRQHYLRFDIRSTPAQLQANGIYADFTMGFASGPGFRAGTSFPFHYYDFSEEITRELLFVPFSAMDGAYTVYNKITPQEALRSLKELKDEIQKVGGPFVTVFHERTFAEFLHPGFAEIYKTLLTKP